ncbi:MAG: hypothetical protein IT281_09955 [Ignavibacteria bacterium]|nr:hypothetical protein [Ignavibacteria bacterium]
MPNANTYLPGTLVIPGSLLISNMTQNVQMVVTVVDSEVNSYVVGQLVRLTVPNPYGMKQANGLTGKITNISGLDFTLDIDSTYFDTFTTPLTLSKVEKPASLSPAGSRNLQIDNNTQRVPFQSLNNIGN